MLKNFFTFSRFTLFVALCISAIAAYYSVVGLTAIFAGAVIPIIVMGSILEIAKITTTVWLHKYWDRASWSIKTYLTSAVIALAFLTSMGIFGLLSKAHSDTGLVSGDVVAQLNLIDEKIKTQRDNVDTARRALQQMDEQVNQRLSRSDNEQGAERAVQIRRQQASERAKLQKEIGDAQSVIAKLNEERAPIAAKNRKVEAEVGPIKYIAALIYGDNPDANLLERAVRWVTILIVVVFDPLAIILILAANDSLKWDRIRFESSEENVFTAVMPENTDNNSTNQELEEVDDEMIENIASSTENKNLDYTHMTPWPDVWNDSDEPTQEQSVKDKVPDFTQGNYKSSTYTILEPSFVFQSNISEETNPEMDTESVESHVDESEITTEVKKEILPEVEIATQGVTTQANIFSSDEDYVIYDGKKISINALRHLKPEMIVEGPIKNDILFGTKFPSVAKTGDIYTRVDVLPHRTFKFNGTRWIQIDRKQNTSYLQNIAYVQLLISKLESGEYDPEQLTSVEQDEISEYLKRTT